MTNPTACLFTLLLALPALAQAGGAPSRSGADVLAGRDCEPLRGRKVGLITNHSGRTSRGNRTVDVIAGADSVSLVALFSPEHGWEGLLDEKTTDTRDGPTGLPVYSLYGETRVPTEPMLRGIDTLVFDIQDVGCRFYTYVSTMRNCLEAAAAHKLRFVVLDRPNPIGGLRLEGPVLAAARRDFVGAHTIPLRHGLTAGELARMIVGEEGLQVDLHVVKCEGWRRADLWDRTGLLWINPSPNMRSLTQALLYPGIGLLEGTNLSVGRGTDTPFEVLGAPWCDGVRLAARLRAADLPGVTFVPVAFTPAASRFRGERCSGINVAITDWRTFEPVRTGVHVACALRALHRDAWDTRKLDWLLKHEPTAAAILAGRPADEIVASWQQDLDLFRMRRQPFLLYE
ncbi:MAG: DUF1343 domain-containing protein [Planctomycetes bacterium]|nr:DUF1343 domain-containing protein [Planctomycetota bacterium]